jgi:ABC-2 type transport system ATP-binding protein
MTSQVAVEAVDLRKEYRIGLGGHKKLVALRGISFVVPAGSVYGLIGPNGAGKSTAIKILLDFVRPTAGKALLFGVPASKPGSRQSVGFVPENPVPYEHLTAREYLRFQNQLGSLGATEQQMNKLLEEVELLGHADVLIRRFSKGMTQRTMLAGALLAAPDLIVLDEPTSGLDPIGRRLVRDLVLRAKHRGASVLLCTHIISDVESLCDRVALLVGGALSAEGPTAEVAGASKSTSEVEFAVEGGFQRAKDLAGAEVKELSVGRYATRVGGSELQVLLAKLLSSGAAVTKVSPVRLSLEDALISAVNAAPRAVGGELQ